MSSRLVSAVSDNPGVHAEEASAGGRVRCLIPSYIESAIFFHRRGRVKIAGHNLKKMLQPGSRFDILALLHVN